MPNSSTLGLETGDQKADAAGDRAQRAEQAWEMVDAKHDVSLAQSEQDEVVATVLETEAKPGEQVTWRPIDFNGFGGTKVKQVSLRTGSYKFIASHDGSGQFAAWVKDKQNNPYQKDAVIFTAGVVNDEEGAIYIKDDDSYILQILAHGKWELSIQKVFQ